MVVAVLATAAVVRLPYYVLLPGQATAVEPLIHVDGAATYRHPGSILFTTVSLAGDVNAYGLVHGWLDANAEVVSRQEITGGVPAKTYDQQNVQAMTDAKTAATKVALERLGYPVTATGEGVDVITVTAGSAAAGKLAAADVITAVDGTAVTLADQAIELVRRHRPGDVIAFTVTRAGKTQSVEVQAGDDGHGAPRLGVALTTRNAHFSFPLKVTIDTGTVGGPSAGLAFTLALLDDLDPADLTGGHKVAVTGTMDTTGRVGPVGGVAQKAAAARRAGAIAFLVPPEEEKDARHHAGRMRIIPVSTLDEALAALAQLGGGGLPQPVATGH